MSLMTVETHSFLPPGQEFTRADLEKLPDDGHRYELIDGTLLVTPAPRTIHQRTLRTLLLSLVETCPSEYEVLFAPFDVVLAENTVIQPDLLIAPRTAFTERNLPEAPLLAVEILSPSTRGVDLLLKKERLQRAGCPHYWVIDPEVPSLTAWMLRDDEYQKTAHVTDAEIFSTDAPFPVSFTPASLRD